MTKLADTRCRIRLLWGAACACCLLPAGCSDPSTSAGIAHQRVSSAVDVPEQTETPETAKVATPEVPANEAGTSSNAATEATADAPSTAKPLENDAAPGDAGPKETAAAPAKDRSFAIEGPDGALRVGFDDLDLLKVIRMDPVTPNCIEKMPRWLRKLDGKTVRIRGFMRPGFVLTNISRFTFVRDTSLCCFGSNPKIYDMIAVTLKPGTTTDHIELRPFDVVGKFRIELEQIDDGTIFQLYLIDDAVIIQK